MCIGIPMKVKSIPFPGHAECEGRGAVETLNSLLLPELKVGDWVLAWNGMATKQITEERAHQVDKALNCLELALNNKVPEVDDAFGDIAQAREKMSTDFMEQLTKRKS